MRNRPLAVASITALLTFGVGASAQAQDRAAQNDSGQQVPDAPQPQKKPAAKPQPSSDSSSPPTQPADNPAPKQPPANDENAFPEAVSRDAAKAADTAKAPDAAKAASDAPDTTKHPTADDNPFPEAISRDAAKAAGNEQAPPAAPKSDLPPGVSSSQSGGSFGDAEKEPGAPAQVADPARAKRDAAVGGFYLQTGEYEGALLRYQDAIASDPTNVDAIFGLAETQRLLRKNADAARNYQLYLDILPNGPKAKQAMKALKALGPGK
jgi:tetratricopeptide (TPR) repeat protein